MPLLVQIYAPLDDTVVGHAEAFHRMLYVFVCASAACVNRIPTPGATPLSVRAVRCQVPREVVEQRGAVLHAPTCAVCGLLGAQRCARCKSAHYCCRRHQGAHWAASHGPAGRECAAASAAASDSPAPPMPVAAAVARGLLFREWELVTEEEPPRPERVRRAEVGLSGAAARALRRAQAGDVVSAGDCDDESSEVDTATTRAAAADGSATISGEGKDEDLSIAGLTQRTLAEATGAALFGDRHARYFFARTAAEPSQVVRYCRWPPPPAAANTATTAKAIVATITHVRDGDVALNASGANELCGTVPSDGGVMAVETSLGDVVPKASSSSGSGSSCARDGENDSGTGQAEEEDDEKDDEEDDLDGGDEEPIGAPLWMSEAHRPSPFAITPCSLCGAERRFEFQIMPQLLAHVTTDAPVGDTAAATASTAMHPSDCDFGTIAVYTCTRSCDRLARAASGIAASAHLQPPYALELVWVQPAAEFVRTT